MVRKTKVEEALSTHRSLMKIINDLSQEELFEALSVEAKKRKRRLDMVKRLYTKFATRREEQERKGFGIA